MKVTAYEQIDFFQTMFSYDLIKLLDRLKDDNSHAGILNKLDKNAYADFIDLIMNNVDLKQFYNNHFFKK